MQFIRMMFIWVFCSFFLCIAYADGLGQISDNLVAGPLSIIHSFMDASCYIVGGILLINSYSRYRRYKISPTEIPISTVVIYFLLALIVLSLPFIYKLSGLHLFSEN
jgi:hypothetical protein